jgi:hydrogenase maturation protease
LSSKLEVEYNRYERDLVRTLVLGLGNPILSDDSIGLLVARELKDRITEEGIDVEETSLAGLRLLDILAGYDKAIIVDAIDTAQGPPGQVYRLSPETFDDAKHLSSVHDVNFATALDLGRRMQMELPEDMVIFGVAVADTATFSEECTPEVERAIPVCVDMIIEELGGH